MSSMTEIFGPVISSYSRVEAIEDGVLVDLSEAGEPVSIYRHPVAMTSALWAEIERGAGKNASTRDARIWDVCYMTAKAGRSMNPTTNRSRVKVGRRSLVVDAVCGPADDGSPCITIGMPEDF